MLTKTINKILTAQHKRFVESIKDDVIKKLVKENSIITGGSIVSMLLNEEVNDFDYYNVYGLGNWGRLRTGGEFWKDFNTNLHVRAVAYNQALPIHMYWDDNVNPYLPCTLWQVDGFNITQFDEIALTDPLNRVKHVCAHFIKKYPFRKTTSLR